MDMCSGGHEKKMLAKSSSTPKTHSAGIGAVFGVDASGAVFFNTAVPGSSCGDAAQQGKLKPGDILYAVDGFTVYKAPLNLVASKLLGPHGSRAKVTFMRGSEQITLDLERRMTGMQAAQKAVSQAKESSGLDKIRYAHETLGN
ncbi:hypothetical protein GUITHDRAFT_152482 [Guillardia theta CCMP2712]|uniref:PDZ domain-containing protein n=1 Tax=Guillardia theta (strain CCMP2712) TaxID=905079 RepID=L1JCX2_GUITC|nr:hypothetical protein GUITHDRAFT_152482 [Guillardia theta CCMP2712]EKX46351.1 hypothetical protein GUITHDRAFT_152482 [Guillardia theta CCMP2712]|eukprot:XP_005833331.1 hypothetical protein GUITHDRAFT_152482 [Guillardia theta CCMP2712]